MLRIHFTSDDIARTRIAPTADPLWELVLSVQMLRPQRGDLLFRGWRRGTGSLIRRAGLGERLRLLFALTPTIGYFPDFLTPGAAINGLEHGLEAIRSTPNPTLHADMRQLALSRPLPDSARRIALGEPHILVELTDTMRTCYDLTVTPYRRILDAAVERDRRIRANALATGGVEGLLASLRPMMTWSSGELSIPTHRDQDLYLDGRGLLLIPSYFCLTGPLTLLDPTRPPVLIYPLARQSDALRPGDHEALAALIGSTRAAILELIAERHATTSELANQIGVSIATASEHATVLRQAGLVDSHREGNRMVHHPTALGFALLKRPGDRQVFSRGTTTDRDTGTYTCTESPL
jgi:DNA-binding transcriptional ArsR family regulator